MPRSRRVAADAPPDRLPEHRWPAGIATLVALASVALLPSTFLLPLRIGIVVLGVACWLALVVENPVRFTRQSRWSRLIGIGFTIALALVNSVFLGQLVFELTRRIAETDGEQVLLASVQVIVVNIIAFALVFWQLDRGGPVARNTDDRSRMPRADFRFPQDEDADAVVEVRARSARVSDWRPSFVDYLYISLTASVAFSAADAVPLSHRAKLLMGYEALVGFVLLALVIARAVSIIG